MGVIKGLAIIMFAALSALLAGCGSPVYQRLHTTDSVGELATLQKAYHAHGNHTSLIVTGAPDAPMRMALHEVNVQGRDRLFVYLHGVFADHRMWRFLAGDLASDFDSLLIDLPGCGESDCLDPDRLPPDAYGLADLSVRTLDSLRVYLRGRPTPPALVFVGHSLGGAMAIRMFSDTELRRRYADVLDRVEHLILLAPLDVAVEKSHPLLIELSRVSGARVWTSFQLGMLRDRVAEGVFQSCNKPERALREEVDFKMQILTDQRRRRAMQAMLNRAVPTAGGRPDWSKIDPLVEAYARVDVPTLIIWGTHDEVLPLSMGYKLAAQLPRARLVAVPAGMHSLVIEEPRAVAWVVREYLAGRNPGRTIEPAHTPTGTSP